MSKFFEQLNLESVTIDFTDSTEILERLFGPDGCDIPDDWHSHYNKNLTSIIDWLPVDYFKLAKPYQHELRNQCLIARAIFDFALESNATLHCVLPSPEENNLELQFSFDTLHSASLFHSGLRDYVEQATGLIL